MSLFVDVVSRRSIRFPSKSEGVKVTSCLVLSKAVKQPGLTSHHAALRVGEFEGKRSINPALSVGGELRDACVHVEQRGHMRCRATQRY